MISLQTNLRGQEAISSRIHIPLQNSTIGSKYQARHYNLEFLRIVEILTVCDIIPCLVCGVTARKSQVLTIILTDGNDIFHNRPRKRRGAKTRWRYRWWLYILRRGHSGQIGYVLVIHTISFSEFRGRRRGLDG
jgi:hypothetical protein